MKINKMKWTSWLMALAVIGFVAFASSCSKSNDAPETGNGDPGGEDSGGEDTGGEDTGGEDSGGDSEVSLDSFLPEAGTTIDFSAYDPEDYHLADNNGRQVYRIKDDWEVSSPLGIDIKPRVVLTDDGVEMHIDPNTGYGETFTRNSLNRLNQKRTSGLFVWTVEIPEIEAEDDYYAGGLLYSSDDLGYALNAYITYGTNDERDEFGIGEGSLAFRVGSDTDPTTHELFEATPGEHEIAIGLVTGDDGNFVALFALDGEVVTTINLEYGPDELSGTDFMPVCSTGTRDDIGGPNHITEDTHTLFKKFEYFGEK